MTITLHQFAFSHFNEKARWALAYKNVAHVKETYLPGPHMGAIKKLSGQTATPLLEIDSEIIAGTSAIIDRLEQDYPEPQLYPSDPDQRIAALAVQTEFDKTVGPAVRTVIFSVLVNEGSYLCRMFAGSKSLPKRLAYRATFPLARGLIAKGNGVTPENVPVCHETTRNTLDQVAEQVAGTGYMVGDTFSVADLTAASLLAPIASVAHPDMKRPEPLPPAMQELVDQFSAHPTIAWVNGIYAKHRP